MSKPATQSESHTKIEGQINRVQLPRPVKLPLHGILHYLRGQIEWQHRCNIFQYSVRPRGPPSLSLETIPKMNMLHMESCCNKSAPIYIFHGQNTRFPGGREAWQLLLAVLHNYLYRTWFRPYRSEIDWGQFLAQVINVRPDSAPLVTEKPTELARHVASMSRAIWARVETT